LALAKPPRSHHKDEAINSRHEGPRGPHKTVCNYGSKLWNIAYRFGGKHLKLSLGAYPPVGLKEAREQRDTAKRLLAAGIDPGQQKKTDALAKANARANTFAIIADELLAKKMREGLAPANGWNNIGVPELGRQLLYMGSFVHEGNS
jgi:Arm DNA-binding domain